MNILHWTEAHWPHIGGAEVFTRELIARLHAAGHACAVLTNRTSDLPPFEEVDGTPVFRLPFSQALAARDLPAIVRLSKQAGQIVQRFRPDVVHLHTSQSGAFFFLRAAAAGRIPSVYTSHDPIIFDDDQTPLLRKILETVDRIVTVSDYMQERIRRLMPGADLRVRTIHYGLESPQIEPAPLDFAAPQLFCAARITENKGFDIALRAFPAVLDRFPAARFVIAGDGPMRSRLEQLSEALGLHDHVTFTGWVAPAEIPRLINESALAVIPSRWEETFGLVTVQAMQVARPVVASAIGGIPEVVADGVTGLLVPPGDPALLAGAILTILEDPERAGVMGALGRTRATELFSWVRCLSEYESVYRLLNA